ncbi:MAG: hypothetical protein F9K37_01480 [Bacteroidales bacterium]|nr:MAG: hypothetical protein F9K37_01480 [Bacteroidales bacterium]
MITQYITSLRVEILKYKRTYALALAVLAPLFISTLFTLVYFFKADKLIAPNTDGFASMLQNSLSTVSSVFFPFYIILLAVLIHNVEHKASSLKDLFSFPVSRFNTYLSKWVVAAFLISASLVLYFVFSVFGAWMVSLKFPELVSLSLPTMLLFAKRIAIVAMSSLVITALQFLISLKWSNVVVPFGVGMVGFISGMVLIRGWKYIHYHPYVQGYMSYDAAIGHGKIALEHFLVYNAIGFVLLFVAGYLLWVKRRIA